MKDNVEEPHGGGDPEPEITLIAVGKHTYYIVEGEEHLDQMLLVEGDYPKPVLCIHFETAAEIAVAMGEQIDMSQYWRVHPEIVARLRATNVLIEKVA